MAINTNVSGLAREALLKGAPSSVNAAGVAREVLVQGAAPNLSVSGVAREILQSGTPLPSPIPVNVGGLSREVLTTTILFVKVAGVAREALVTLPPPPVFVSALVRENLIPGVVVTRVMAWRMGW